MFTHIKTFIQECLLKLVIKDLFPLRLSILLYVMQLRPTPTGAALSHLKSMCRKFFLLLKFREHVSRLFQNVEYISLLFSTVQLKRLILLTRKTREKMKIPTFSVQQHYVRKFNSLP